MHSPYLAKQLGSLSAEQKVIVLADDATPSIMLTDDVLHCHINLALNLAIKVGLMWYYGEILPDNS